MIDVYLTLGILKGFPLVIKSVGTCKIGFSDDPCLNLACETGFYEG